MVVQVVTRQVREHAPGKLQSADALLGYGMAGTLHEHIFTACIRHSLQQFVQLNGIRCCVAGGHCLVFNIVAHSGEQSAFVTHLAEHII